MIKKMVNRYKEQIIYLFFGVLTTIINIAIYNILFVYFGVSNIISNCFAWGISVLFAYITNKIWIFRSENQELKTIFYEITTFFSCRLLTGGIDLLIMYLGVDVFKLQPMNIKLIANVIVIVINYIVSKKIIFVKKDNLEC